MTQLGLLFLLCTSDQQKHKLCKGPSINIPTKFGSNWPSGFKEYKNFKAYGRQMMTKSNIDHLPSLYTSYVGKYILKFGKKKSSSAVFGNVVFIF